MNIGTLSLGIARKREIYSLEFHFFLTIMNFFILEIFLKEETELFC